MRKFYKTRRNRVLAAIESSPYAPRLTIREENAGLHFLVQVDTPMTDEELVTHCAKSGIRVQSLKSFYHGPLPEKDKKCLVINYSGLSDAKLDELEKILSKT